MLKLSSCLLLVAMLMLASLHRGGESVSHLQPGYYRNGPIERVVPILHTRMSGVVLVVDGDAAPDPDSGDSSRVANALCAVGVSSAPLICLIARSTALFS